MLNVLFGIERKAEQLAGQPVARVALVGGDVLARKRLCEIYSSAGDAHPPCRRRRRAAPVDGGGALRVPSRGSPRASIARAPACRDVSTAPRRPPLRRPGRCGRRSRSRTSRSPAPFRGARRADARRRPPRNAAFASKSHASRRRRARRRRRSRGPCSRANGWDIRIRRRWSAPPARCLRRPRRSALDMGAARPAPCECGRAPCRPGKFGPRVRPRHLQRAARIAFHSFGATTASRSLICTTCARGCP